MTANIARYFYRCSTPFHHADSKPFRQMIAGLKPSYERAIPTARTLATTLLDQEHARLKRIMGARPQGTHRSNWDRPGTPESSEEHSPSEL